MQTEIITEIIFPFHREKMHCVILAVILIVIGLASLVHENKVSKKRKSLACTTTPADTDAVQKAVHADAKRSRFLSVVLVAGGLVILALKHLKKD